MSIGKGLPVDCSRMLPFMGLARNVLSALAKPMGYRLVRASEKPTLDFDLEDDFKGIAERCRSFTMTSTERMYALWQGVRHVIRSNIPGDFVECGVWKGGSAMLIALTLKQLSVTDRRLWLYDTFEGMSEPTAKDICAQDGQPITPDKLRELTATSDAWKSLEQPLDAVKANLASTGYPAELLRFVKGKVEATIPAEVPTQLALLRLDTDWYESTKHELEHLYPRLSAGGVLIIDDYGFWKGAREAVDEYIQRQKLNLLLARVDVTGRICVKPSV